MQQPEEDSSVQLCGSASCPCKELGILDLLPFPRKCVGHEVWQTFPLHL